MLIIVSICLLISFIALIRSCIKFERSYQKQRKHLNELQATVISFGKYGRHG